MRALARARLDALADRDQFDVRHDYASPVPAQVAALQLGFPIEDAELLVALVNRSCERDPDVRRDQRRGPGARTRSSTTTSSSSSPSGAPRPRATTSRPTSSTTCCAYAGAHGPLDDAEIADAVVDAVHRRLRDPAQDRGRRLRTSCGATPDAARRGWSADPDGGADAFEEMLRHELPLQFVGRTLRVDAEVAGVPMRAGPARRAPADLRQPRRARVRRARALRRRAARMDRHLGFGHGVHVCIGAHVARLEGVVMVQELLARFPALRGRRGRACAREVSEFHVGWARMPISPEVTYGGAHDAAHHRRRHPPHRAARRVDDPGAGAVPRRGAARRCATTRAATCGCSTARRSAAPGSPRSRAGPSRSPPARRPTRSATRRPTTPTPASRYMDEVGIWAQVLYPNVAGFGSQRFLSIRDDELKLVCVRAYNDFLRDWASADAPPPDHDHDHAVLGHRRRGEGGRAQRRRRSPRHPLHRRAAAVRTAVPRRGALGPAVVDRAGGAGSRSTSTSAAAT